MPIFDTSALTPETRLTPSENLQVYNGLDVCLTLEIFEELSRQFNTPPSIYEFEKALQGPYLDIMLRGFLIDEVSRRRAASECALKITHLRKILNRLAIAIWDKPLNPRSPEQLKQFFYGMMKLPEVWISQKGQRRVSTNREALEKLETYLYARPFISCILAIRDLSKQLEVFTTSIDPDHRYRTSYNIAGTECISGDSIVWTKGGLRSIEDIYNSKLGCQIWNGTYYCEPVRKIKYVNQDGKKITLEHGFQLKCSNNHPIMTQRGFISASELLISDKIEINNGLPVLFGQHAINGSTLMLSEDLCELIGMILADGTINNNSEHHRCRLTNSSKVIRDRFAELATRIFNVKVGQSGDEAYFSSIPVVAWLCHIGMLYDEGSGTATRKFIPETVMRGKPNLLRALLRGLTLDTHITDHGLMYGTQSYKMREQIQQILLILGIISNKIEGEAIKLCIPRAYCGRFLSMIGFVSPKKLNQLSELLNIRSHWIEPYQAMSKVFISIKEITDWRGDVYDITMPANNPAQYVANGITVHNSGRASSSENAFGTGSNLQNIPPGLRYVFVSDPGWKLANIDLEQVEARDVGFFIGCLFDDWTFLDSCESGDLHSNNARLIWPELPWTGDLRQDRAIADANFYREYSYRDMAKRGSHLSNYRGTAWTAARSLKVPQAMMEEFQARYCRGRGLDIKRGLPAITPAFPGISRYWDWVTSELQTRGWLETPFGRKRQFFGNPNDDATQREAIAFLPQSTTADRTNLGLWRVWKYMPEVQMLAQTHDSITFQYRESADETDIISRALQLVSDIVLIAPNGRRYSVPGEAKIGWNWGNASPTNPDGLIKFKPSIPDTRIRSTGLERTML